MNIIDKIHKVFCTVQKNRIIENVNKSSFSKNCLLVYVIDPFLCSRIRLGHQNQWQARELARIVGTYGYNVDVVHFTNSKARLAKTYDMLIDVHPGMSDYSSIVSDQGIKIAYITGSNPSFSNQSELQRLEDLFLRRGVRLAPHRYAPPFSKELFESYDAMFFFGNRYNFATYHEFNISHVCFIRNTGYAFPIAVTRSLDRSAKKFLFLGGLGQVHKGLDLLLEVFSRRPDLSLYICSAFKSEPDFCNAYNRELFDCPNIHPVGFMNVFSQRFYDIASHCGFLILPSCSEGIAGSVLTGMSVGLVPIVSRECGFEEDEVHILEDCTLETIDATVNDYSEKPKEWMQMESEKVLSLVRAKYSENAFTSSVNAAFTELFRELSG